MRRSLLLLTVLLSLPLGAQPKTPVKVTLEVRTRWKKLSPTSAAAISTAQASADPDLEGLHRQFFLPNSELVLGEPLLVEYRVWTSGDPWSETMGGRYRGSGRDDNFVFLLRRSDGSWVDDPYGQVFNLGGLSTQVQVTAEQSLSHWLPVQRWCALKEPGAYTVYALHWRNDHTIWGRAAALNAQLPERFQFEEQQGLIEADTGKPSTSHQLEIKWNSEPLPPSPLVLDAEVVKELKRRNLDPRELDTFGRFMVKVKSGEPQLEPWLKLASQELKSWPDNKAAAAKTALWYSQVGEANFLEPLLADAGSNELTGLALHPSPKAAKMLTRANPEQVLHSLHRLRPEHRSVLRPWLESLLAGPHAESARQILAQW